VASVSPSGVVLVVANGAAEAGRERARRLGPVRRRRAETGATAGGDSRVGEPLGEGSNVFGIRGSIVFSPFFSFL